MISPLAFTSSAPNALKIAPVLLTEFAGLSQSHPERVAGLVAGFRRVQEGIVVPPCRERRIGGMGRVHRLHIDAGEVLQHRDPGAARQAGGGIGSGHCQPVALFTREVLDDRIVGPVLVGQVLDHVIDRFEVIRIVQHIPLEERDEVMTGL